VWPLVIARCRQFNARSQRGFTNAGLGSIQMLAGGAMFRRFISLSFTQWCGVLLRGPVQESEGDPRVDALPRSASSTTRLQLRVRGLHFSCHWDLWTLEAPVQWTAWTHCSYTPPISLSVIQRCISMSCEILWDFLKGPLNSWGRVRPNSVNAPKPGPLTQYRLNQPSTQPRTSARWTICSSIPVWAVRD